MGVGMPQEILLREFGEHVRAAFGEMAYHVGSSLRLKDGWRDVDVRVLLPDDVYAAMGLGDPDRPQESRKWVAITLAWSAFGRALTGLPVDFQLQQRTHANATFSGRDAANLCSHPRSALFALHTMVQRSDAPGTQERSVGVLREASPEPSAADARPGWQPIETYREPQGPVLVAWRDGELWQRVTAMYSPAASMEGWWAWGARQVFPTHWMPLPKGPDAPTTQKG